MRGLAKVVKLALLAASLSSAAFAAPPPHTVYEGVWQFRYQDWNAKGPPTKPEFTPETAAVNKARSAARPANYVRSAANMLCLPRGGPGLFTIRSPFVIMEGFGRIMFTFETEGSNQPRTVYMNEKTQPENIYPSFNGHSIGRWDGQALVVDTVGFVDRGSFPGNVPVTENSHLTERFSWSKDGKVMTADITVNDPKVLAKPYAVQLVFDKLPDTEERFEVWCEPDLDAFQTLDLPSLAKSDPEVARLVDPALRPSDPALKIAAPAAK